MPQRKAKKSGLPRPALPVSGSNVTEIRIARKKRISFGICRYKKLSVSCAESALTKYMGLKSFRICTYRKIFQGDAMRAANNRRLELSRFRKTRSGSIDPDMSVS
jgi:hypothetical protein